MIQYEYLVVQEGAKELGDIVEILIGIEEPYCNYIDLGNYSNPIEDCTTM